MEKENLGIIVLNYNQLDYTINCVDSIYNSHYDNFELILIDNGSTEEGYERLREEVKNKSKLNLLRLTKNVGYVGGVNIGLAECSKKQFDYCIVMNNDTVIDANAIKELVLACKRQDNKAIVTGKVYHYSDKKRLQFVGYEYINKKYLKTKKLGLDEMDYGQYDIEEERDMIDDIFWLMPLDLYRAIGGYSDYFWFNSEQADFAMRAKKKGYRLIYTPSAKIWHKGSVSIGGRERNPKLAFWTIQSSLILRCLHIKSIDFIFFYLKTVESIVRTYLKTFFLRSKSINKKYAYPNAKLKGLLYFNRWFFKRNKNVGYNPFI